VLNVGDLEALLASGAVEVTTTGSDIEAKGIAVGAALAWSTSNALTLDAGRSLAIDKSVSIQGEAGLTLAINDGGKIGTLSFGRHGSVTFANLSSTLTIDGLAYTLADTIQSLADLIAARPSGNYAFAADSDDVHRQFRRFGPPHFQSDG